MDVTVLPPARRATGFACGEVRGGNEPIYEQVELPGIRGVLYSRPCRGGSGGDVHYVSVCGSGLLSRVSLADVAGHGETIAAVGAEMHAHLRRSVDTIDERRVLSRLDVRLDRVGLQAMTTAALATYYPPARRLTVSYAGHPPGWLYRAEPRQWTRLDGPAARRGEHAFVDLPLGTGLGPGFTRRRFRVSPGDRMLLVTDGVLEAPSPEGLPLGDAGLEAVLQAGVGHVSDPNAIAEQVLSALRDYVDSPHLSHDDVTFFVGEFVPGPPGPALWHVVKNRVLGRWAG
jgi:sigma-B regulation protein RsbU (phosphoserine phosphatase)